jgi:hypothetical protein
VLVNALVVQPSVESVAETNMERGNTLNAQRFYVRFGSRDLRSRPRLLRTIPYHIYTCSKTLPDVKEEIMVKTASW